MKSPLSLGLSGLGTWKLHRAQPVTTALTQASLEKAPKAWETQPIFFVSLGGNAA